MKGLRIANLAEPTITNGMYLRYCECSHLRLDNNVFLIPGTQGYDQDSPTSGTFPPSSEFPLSVLDNNSMSYKLKFMHALLHYLVKYISLAK